MFNYHYQNISLFLIKYQILNRQGDEIVWEEQKQSRNCDLMSSSESNETQLQRQKIKEKRQTYSKN